MEMWINIDGFKCTWKKHRDTIISFKHKNGIHLKYITRSSLAEYLTVE